MKYRHLTRLVTFAGIFLAATATLPAAVIYSDNFSFTGDLNGRTPTTTTGGNTWTAGNGTSSAYLGDGSVVNVDPSGHTRAYLDFTPETGTIYTLKGEMAQDADSTDWLTLGFAGSNPADDGFFANGGISTLLLRDDGEVDWYQGPALNNTVDGGTISGFAVNTFYEFELVLDTTGSQWTVDAFAAGNQLDLNGAAAGSTFTWATNPTIGSVMLSTHEDAVGSYDNFELTVVPEPSAGLLLLLGLLPVYLSRRRRVS